MSIEEIKNKAVEDLISIYSIPESPEYTEFYKRYNITFVIDRVIFSVKNEIQYKINEMFPTII